MSNQKEIEELRKRIKDSDFEIKSDKSIYHFINDDSNTNHEEVDDKEEDIFTSEIKEEFEEYVKENKIRTPSRRRKRHKISLFSLLIGCWFFYMAFQLTLDKTYFSINNYAITGQFISYFLLFNSYYYVGKEILKIIINFIDW